MVNENPEEVHRCKASDRASTCMVSITPDREWVTTVTSQQTRNQNPVEGPRSSSKR
jgi:hypothetical protein